MDKPLKTAYQLASSRWIMPTEREEPIEEAKEDTFDFVESWKNPDKETNPSEYDRAFVPLDVEQKKIMSKKKIKNNDNLTSEEGLMAIQPQTIHYDNVPELHWYGNFNSYTGFSKMNRVFTFGLADRNVAVKIDNQESPIEVNESTMDQIRKMEKTLIAEDAPKVFSATIPLKLMHHGKKVLFTMMENSQTLHRDYVEKLNMFNEIWVPTRFNKEMFLNNGVKSDIRVIPLGVDTSRYHPNIKPFEFQFPLNKFVFISVFKWNHRKGWDILLKSYLEEFSQNDDVSLLIVSRTDTNHNRNIILNDVKGVTDYINKSDLPHVALYDKQIPEKDMPSIYKRCNAFVLISRGEGFGLPYCEASACGLPVISSYCSGPTDYLTEDNSFLVMPDSYEKASINGKMANLAKHCRFYEDQIFPFFGENAINKTKQHMRYVYENYNQAINKTKNLTIKMHKELAWKNSIDKIYECVLNMQK